jgi:hypothetical protein
VGGDGQSFDFSYFLKLSHENNLLTIVDLDISRWVMLIVVYGITSIEQEFVTYSFCESDACIARCMLLVYTVFGGIFLLVAACFIAYVNRRSEIKLLRQFGVEDVTDYEIFMMREANIKEVVGTRMVDMKTLMIVVAELKHEKALKRYKRIQRLQGMYFLIQSYSIYTYLLVDIVAH